MVVESVEAAVRFATLLGARAEAADTLLRAPLTAEALLGAPMAAATVAVSDGILATDGGDLGGVVSIVEPY